MTLRALDRKGSPVAARGEIYLPDDPLFFSGDTTVRLPRGEHDLAAFVSTGKGAEAADATLLSAHVVLTADTAVTLDARLARPVDVAPPRASARLVVGAVSGAGLRPGYSFQIGILATDSYQGIFTGHIGPPSDRAAFSSYVHGPWAEPGATWRSWQRGTARERWGTGVLGPALPKPWFKEIWVRQFPETLVFAVPMFSGASPGHFGDARTETAQTTLYRDGVRVADSPEAGYVLYQAPAGPAEIRVETQATQRVYETSTEIRASWRFRTRSVPGPDGVLLPVMAVRLQPELGDDNAAPAGRTYPIPISVERQPGAPPAKVASLTVEVSYDDGQTWQRVVPRRTGGDWPAHVRNPDRGFVSLRAVATDTDGNSLDQTVIRAYRVR